MIQVQIAPAETLPAEEGNHPDASPPSVVDCHDPRPLGGVWKGELHFQRCTWCRTAIFRRLLCPACASTDLTTERSSGIGTIHHVSIMGRNVGRPWALATIRMREEFSIRAKVLDVYRAHVGAVVCLDSGMEAGSQQISFRPYDAPARAKSAPTRK